MNEKAVSPFWTFSLKIYRIEGVAPACLTLQDRHGVDVNVMLYGLWLASQGRVLGKPDMHEIMDAMAGWKNGVVVPLRSVRRLLRDPAAVAGKAGAAFDPAMVGALRDQVKKIELEAERLQQEALYALKPVASWGATGAPLEAASANLAAYAGAMRAEFDPAACKAMLEGFAKAIS